MASDGLTSGALLRQYIRNGAKVILARLTAPDVEHSASLCDSALQMVRYCVLAHEGWSECRQIIPAVAPGMERFGEREEWIVTLESITDWAREEEDTESQAQIHLLLGQTNRRMDRYPAAEGWLQKSVEGFRGVGDPKRIAFALNQLGRVYFLQYRYAEALTCAGEALTHLEAGDPERAESHYVLGMVALNQRRWAEAETHHSLALDFRLQMEDERTIGWAYQNLGLLCLMQSIYGDKDRLQEADKWLRLAVELLEQASDPYHLAITWNSLGSVQVRLGRYLEGLKLYQQASATMRPLGGVRLVAQIYNNLGLLHLHLAEPEKAEAAFRDGIAIYEDIGDHPSRLNTQHGVVMALLQQKRYEEAAALCEHSLEEIERLQDYPEEYEEKRRWYSDSLQKARQRTT